jgi:hypothetical protein
MKNSHVLFVLLLLTPHARAAEPTSCPDSITVQQQLKTSVEGWKSTLDDTPSRLAQITFYDGNPDEKASLIPDRTSKSGGKETSIWNFNFKTAGGIWLACGYSGTSVVLIRQLPPKTASCSVTYNPRQRISGLPVIEHLSCK